MRINSSYAPTYEVIDPTTGEVFEVFTHGSIATFAPGPARFLARVNGRTYYLTDDRIVAQVG